MKPTDNVNTDKLEIRYFDFEIFYSGIMENHEAEIRNSEMKSSLAQPTKFLSLLTDEDFVHLLTPK